LTAIPSSVPFIARGPGIPKGKISHVVSSHHDLAPTFVALAGGDEHVPSWVDGGVIPLTKNLKRHPKPVSKESFAVEFWSLNQMAENYPTATIEGPNTYKTLRVISHDYNCKLQEVKCLLLCIITNVFFFRIDMYAIWCTGEHEFYDLKTDPYEMKNLYQEANIQLVNRIDALLVVLKSCRAETCRDPWRILHPNDKYVKTLEDALHHKV
jgi:arylsulfatase A-like enzyme